MNWDCSAGQWKQFTSCIKERRGKLTDGHNEQADAQREKFIGIIQEQYGITREAAEEQLREWDWEWGPRC